MHQACLNVYMLSDSSDVIHSVYGCKYKKQGLFYFILTLNMFQIVYIVSRPPQYCYKLLQLIFAGL